MSDAPTVPVSIHILDKEYMISCPEDEKEALLESARVLAERLREVRDSGKVLGAERMAVITALNLVHELGQARRAREREEAEVEAELRRLAGRIEAELGRRAPETGID